MSSTATRPTGTGARFVAYDRKAERIGNPEDGTAISVRAETFVEEYVSIRVSAYTEKSSGGFASVYVKFDAASVGDGKMEYDFGASTEPKSRVAARLKHAHENDIPVYVALETCRRKKNGAKEPISVLTPIHVLRGAQPGSASGEPQTTKANCVRVIAAAGSVDDADDTDFGSEKDLRSDPAEWEQLRGNRLGDIAPEGWRCLMKDGQRTGGITNHVRETSTSTAEIAAAVADQLIANGYTQPAQVTARLTSDPIGVRRTRAAEARAWEPLNTDNRPNAGSYLAAKIRATHETAVYLFAGALETAADQAPELTEDAELEHVWGLTDLLLWIADRAQAKVVGGEPDRNAASHKEAALWVAQVVNTRYPYTVEHITSDEARKGWAITVLTSATANFHAAYKRIAQYMGVDLDAIVDSEQRRTVDPSATRAITDAATTEAATVAVETNSSTDPAPQIAAPEPATSQPADKDPDAVREWQELAATIGMADHIMKLRFILAATFGVQRGMLSEIDAVALKSQVAEWRTNPQDFFTAARAAHDAATAATQLKAS
jgi:hypothetical protein